jgi:hypothetical protein
MRVQQKGFSQKKPDQLVYLELGSGNGGMLLSLSKDGFRFRAVTPVRANGEVPFAFSLDGKIRLEGTGEIEWIEDDGKSGGMRFADVSPEFRAILSDWLSEDSARHSPGREVSSPPATPSAAPDDTMEKIQQELRSGFPQRPLKTAPQQKIAEQNPPVLTPERAPELAVPEQKTEQKPEQKTKSSIAARIFPLPDEHDSPPRLFPLQAPPLETDNSSSSAFLKPASDSKAPAANPAPAAHPTARSLLSGRYAPADAPVVPVPVQTAAQPRPYVPPLEDTFDNAWEHARLTAPEESPHLSRAAAGSIIAIALAAILGALIYNFKQDIGGTFIHLGQSISGDHRSAVSAPAIEAKPDAAPSEQQNTEQKPADAGVQSGSAPENAADSANPNPASPNANGAGTIPTSGLAGGNGSAPRSGNSQTSESASSPVSPSAKAAENPAAQMPADSTGKKPALPAIAAAVSPGISAATPADSGSGQEEYKVAQDILRGSNRRRDLQVAVSLLWSGVRKGYVPAEVALADLFRRGEGVPRNCDQARVLLVAASKRGSFDARLMLERMAEQGCE